MVQVVGEEIPVFSANLENLIVVNLIINSISSEHLTTKQPILDQLSSLAILTKNSTSLNLTLKSKR